jgi:CheY-like chemotaxis protein
MTEGLQEKVFGPLTDRQRRSLTTIETSGNHLLSLINDVLDVSKIESGQLELDYAAVNMSLLCNSSLTLVKQQAHKKYLHLETHVPSTLPEIYGDERLLRQMLVNLLSNAVKFTPEEGRITVTAAYTALSPEAIASNRDLIHPEVDPAATVGILTLSVADTGIGISPENAKKLFQPFIQIDSALNRQYQGTGLGLALVKRIAEIHGGKVALTSAVGSGSCFTLQLPIIPIPTGHVSTTAIPSSIEAIAPLDPTTAPLILLAEDNAANVSTITAYLTAKGYSLIVAKNGLEAVNLATSANPDLILMDIQMPQLDGLAAIRQIRQNPALANVPIVALTALAMPADRERCLAAGADDYISKPIRLKQLAQMIPTLLAKPSAE